MKIALSMDGRIAAARQGRTKLTGAAADRLIHFERAEVDAVAVGSGTVLADDPLLTPRGAFRRRPLARIVFDGRLRTPPSAKLISTVSAGPVIIVSTAAAADAAPERVRALVAAGARVETVAAESRLRAGLELLAGMGINSLLVEGGATLHSAIWNARLVDRIEMYVTPQVLGADAVEWLPFPVVGSGALVDTTASAVGEDVRIEGYVHWAH
jgi:diaminohydroxyphosphoribosylaminopyrimidine deaminase/5-amino-6-(5-phosphoribosylamino)uracil reductase